MTAWQRYCAYARQNGQDPHGDVTFTSRQARRYCKKWRREDNLVRRRYGIQSTTQVSMPRFTPKYSVDLNGQGVHHRKLKRMKTIKVVGNLL